MSEGRHVLDASALLAIFFREPGAPSIYDILPTSVIGAVNLSEVVTKMQERGLPDDEIDLAIKEFELVVVPFDVDQAMYAGKLRASTRAVGLSLGDRACLALAAVEGATAVTMDRNWAKLGLSIPIRVARD